MWPHWLENSQEEDLAWLEDLAEILQTNLLDTQSPNRRLAKRARRNIPQILKELQDVGRSVAWMSACKAFWRTYLSFCDPWEGWGAKRKKEENP